LSAKTVLIKFGWLGVDPVEPSQTGFYCFECCCLWKILMVASSCLFRRIRPVVPVTSDRSIRSDATTSWSGFSLSKI